MGATDVPMRTEREKRDGSECSGSRSPIRARDLPHEGCIANAFPECVENLIQLGNPQSGEYEVMARVAANVEGVALTLVDGRAVVQVREVVHVQMPFQLVLASERVEYFVEGEVGMRPVNPDLPVYFKSVTSQGIDLNTSDERLTCAVEEVGPRRPPHLRKRFRLVELKIDRELPFARIPDPAPLEMYSTVSLREQV